MATVTWSPSSSKTVRPARTRNSPPAAAFIFIGLDPNTDFVKDVLETDKWDFITTGETIVTNVEGVFAACDARGGNTKQVASAMGEGATAALMIRNYMDKEQGNRGYKGD